MDSEPEQVSESPDATSVIDALLARAHLAPPHELPELVRGAALGLGAEDAVIHLVDLQQTVLIAFQDRGGPSAPGSGEALPIDGTLAGRTFQQLQPHCQDELGRVVLWLPLLDGAERLGVLAVTLASSAAALDAGGDDSRVGLRWRRLATVIAELIMTKSMYGDTIVRLRRLSQMGLAAETQWSLLPPLTFASPEVTVAGALEPAYEVAGDTFDYAVDDGVTRAAIFDGMGHGLHSAQLAVLAVSAYRNARRAGRSLADTAAFVDGALVEVFGGSAFTTAVFVELDTTRGVLRWLSAGHPLPWLLRDRRVVKQLEVAPSLPLGVRVTDFDAGPVSIGEEQLEPGDRIVLFTDGVTDARSPGKEFFGEARLVDLLVRTLAAGLPVAETLRRAVHELLNHHQNRLDDDATLLMLEWRSTNLAVFDQTLAGIRRGGPPDQLGMSAKRL